MVSRSLASGAMLVVLLGAAGAALWQQRVEVSEASVADVEIAEEAALPAAPEDEIEPAEAVPDETAPDDGDEVRVVGPIVTVNGRPLGSLAAPATPSVGPVAAPATEGPAVGAQDDPVEIAIAPPPPPARPEGLFARPAPDVLDYNAIAEAAYGTRADDLVRIQDQPVPGPLPPEPIPQLSDQQHLVRIVGPDGQAIWVYPDQIERPESRVVIERWQAPNPFGFLYE